MHPLEKPLALTMPQAVQVSGLSRTAIYNALKRREITAQKAGRRTIILFSELEAYLANLPKYGGEE